MALTDIDAGRLADNVFNVTGANKNRIINGDMRIDQRNAGASVTPTASGYTLDRWRAGVTDASLFSVQRSTTAPTGFTNSLVFTSLSADSGSAGDQYGISQRIEGYQIGDLAWGTANAKTVTLSFWVRSSLTGTFGGSIRNNSVNRSYVFTYSIAAANTWEYKTITIPGDTSGTWDTSTNIGILLNFGLGEGSSVSGTAGSWSSNNYTGATGAVQVTATNGATWYITGVQLEAGSVATPFEHRNFGDELVRCQRYCQRYQSAAAPNGSIAAGTCGSSSVAYFSLIFVNQFRASPDMTINNLGSIAKEGVGWFANTAINSIGAQVNSTTLQTSQTNNNMVALDPTRIGLGLDLLFSAEI